MLIIKWQDPKYSMFFVVIVLVGHQLHAFCRPPSLTIKHAGTSAHNSCWNVVSSISRHCPDNPSLSALLSGRPCFPSWWLRHGLKESNGGVFVCGTPAALQIEMLMRWAVRPAIWLLMDRVYPLGWCSLHLLERQKATEWKSDATCTLYLACVLLILWSD